MALKKCKECGGEVARSAPTCPHCGVKNPGNTISTGAGCLIILVLLVVGAIIVGDDTTTSRNATRPSAVAGAVERWVWGAANVREGRGTDTPVASQLQAGARVFAKDQQAGWWAVYSAVGVQMGYVSGSLLHAERLPDAISAYVMAHQFIEDQLRAPRTAKFPSGSSAHQVEHLGSGKFRVVSFVDAQNAFGAMIRTTYAIEMQYLGNDRWRMTDVAMQ